MKILVDENLPPRLGNRVADLFGAMFHADELELRGKTDTEIWNFAIGNDFDAILTADIDFQNRVLELGPPPK